MIILIRIVFIMFFLSPLFSYAQEATGQSVISQGLKQSLSELKHSADQLASSNEVLAVKNLQLKAHLNSLQINLQKLTQENQGLTNAKSKLDASNPAKAEQIDSLGKSIPDLDGKIHSLEEQIKQAQEQLAKHQKEEQEVNGQIAQMLNKPQGDNSAAVPFELSQLRLQRQKEKLATLKMISEIQAHEELLGEQISDFQKGINPSVGEEKLKQKEVLEAKIQQLQQEIDQLNALTNASSRQGGSVQEQLYHLEVSVDDLEKNRNELKNLVAKMQKKAQNVHLIDSQRGEQDKLQANIVQLKMESRGLKSDLEELQQQMVELDKRKAYLETLF